jgi:murein DD-endopeptidase MepM/ murein hydrolase activator NlpD
MLVIEGIVVACLVLQAQHEPDGLRGGGGPPPPVDCVTPLERADAERVVAAYHALRPALVGVAPQKFTFYPLAGRLYRDLFTGNFNDVRPGPGVLDWDCTNFTYNGHDATDVGLRTFGEQLIGVPVFAALDGVVIATHDGENDMHTSCSGIANSVIIDHGAGRVCHYWHLRKNSVAVAPGQVVRAGQPLGLAGSSGCSSGPHLHFATYDNGIRVEPYTGTCNPGPSEWVEQTPIERALYVRDLNVTNVDISTYPGLPVDMPRQGTFVAGAQPVRFWANLINLPAGSTWSVRFLRPDGTVALDSGTVAWSTPFLRSSWWWWSYAVNLDVTGTWKIGFALNGATAAEAPFDVVATAAEVVNRPPTAINVALWPPQPDAGDVLQCLVDTDLVLDDPDYDIVRYRYVWTVDNTVVRDVVTAAHSDALARGTARTGSLVACEVTPSDGIASGPSAMDADRIRPRVQRRKR